MDPAPGQVDHGNNDIITSHLDCSSYTVVPSRLIEPAKMDVDEDPNADDMDVEPIPSPTEPDLSEPLDPDVDDDDIPIPDPDPPSSPGEEDLPDPDIVLDEDGNVVPGNNTSPLIVDVGGAEAGETVGEGNPAVSLGHAI